MDTTKDRMDEQSPEQKDVVISGGEAQTGGIPASGAVDRTIPDRTISGKTPEEISAGERSDDVAPDQDGYARRSG